MNSDPNGTESDNVAVNILNGFGLFDLWHRIVKRDPVTGVWTGYTKPIGGTVFRIPWGVTVAPDGSMVDDFLIQEADRVINVNNAPSPAATASLNIGRTIVERLIPRLA